MRHRNGFRACVLVAAAVLALGVVSGAFGAPDRPNREVDDLSPVLESPERKQQLERERERMQRGRSAREAPGARARRRRSARAYSGRSRRAALEVARAKHRDVVERPPWKPIRLRRGGAPETGGG